MKVLYITPGCFDKGGISRYSRYQIEALRENSELNLKALSLLGPDANSIEEDFQVDWNASSNNIWSQIKLAIIIIKHALLWQPKVIHIAHINLSGLAWFASLLCRAKVVLNVYGLEVWSGLSWDAKLGLQKAHKIISDCRYTRDFILDNKMVKNDNISVIWDCVDHQKFFPAEVPADVYNKYNIPTDKKIILCLGRISHSARHKGYERLIKVFKSIIEHGVDACLVFAGRGDYLDELKNKVKELGIGQYVVFTNSVDEQDLPDIYRLSHVFSLVSDRGKGRGEGIPLTPLEAMACGKPVIVGNHDGSQEAIIDNNGFVIDPFNYDVHAKHLRELLSNETLHQAQVENAKKVSINHFSFEIFSDKHKQFYEELS
ncbi:glycosyltransferase family 4 protein [Carboxylicivirga sp. N1Y90]|uniref:glycosyltransferase family 4 protein n=1 Tax=Carboxylicivirga fragile TaxID=3417571 RepID=UPI003D3595A3|nr:glycosyltransferase family 4 protein [Marinilabiliaceae bacterium N1Y90]